MTQVLQCSECEEFTTLVAPQIYAGFLRCAACMQLGLFIPETDLTPRDKIGLFIEEYELLNAANMAAARAN